MSHRTLATWIESRRPPVPAAFEPFVRPRRPEAPASVAALVEEARHRLAAMEGAELREGAFHLLAADGFATWACERALAEDDPSEALRGVLDTLIE